MVAVCYQGSLIANMIMGIIILRKRYTPSKYISVLMITLGIIICTIISGSSVVRDFDLFLVFVPNEIIDLNFLLISMSLFA